MRQIRATTAPRAAALALAVAASTLMLVGGGQPASGVHRTVTEVEGSAFGCFASVGLFGGPPNVRGPIATATLPPGGGADTEATPTCNIVIGPANLFTSGPTLVETVGSTGPTGSVSSSATLAPVNTSGDEIFTASSLSGTCTASESGVVGSTTVTNGTIILQDPNPDTSGEPGEQIVNIPTNPAPNTTYEGTVANVNDNFRAAFNEQIVNPDGSLTVNAYHLYLLGPTAVGDVIAGQSVCGVTTEVAPTTTTGATTTTTTGATTTTTTGATTTTTTVAPTTTTVVAPTTTTSRPGNMPTNKDQCKNGGYAAFGFRNQGQCVSFVNQQNRR
ncbi:MAG: hypothetical protein M3179_13700 [Actinomycetota bacterium]|nr:hypothetical protein [Actinomycetota bacterium]